MRLTCCARHSTPSRGASFSDEIASARGMVAMANGQDTTPRTIYGAPARTGSGDAYGFGPHHSQHSSISSAGGYSYYNGSYSGSVDGSSVTDYSSASEDARTLPGTSQLINGFPPEPGTMMTQFNAKMSPSAQKKHKCKICDKRFTRPSSLQTHMYSHTGEKRKFSSTDGGTTGLTLLFQHSPVTMKAADVNSLLYPTCVGTRRCTKPKGIACLTEKILEMRMCSKRQILAPLSSSLRELFSTGVRWTCCLSLNCRAALVPGTMLG